MARILLRAWKGPFDVFPADVTLAKNRIGNNSGNLIFGHAAYRILSTPDAKIKTIARPDASVAARANANYDVFVVPLASAFRFSFERHLIRLTEMIERLTIPVMVFGVGAQSTLDYDASRLTPINDSVKAFVKAVLDRSPSIGVRGEFTAEYLKGLGFKDVDVIGCPSMFMYGDALHVEKRVPHLTTDSKLSINVSPYVKPMGPIVMSHVKRYPDLTYIAQDLPSLRTMLEGDLPEDAGKADLNPVYTSHPLFKEGKARFFVDPWTWFDHLKSRDFAFGTRIHGNIASLIAGTPSYVLAHDSRTLELARYFEIPHRTFDDITPDLDAKDLYEEADYSALNQGHKARLAHLVEYLDAHKIDHVFKDGRDASTFDDRLEMTTFPPAVTGPLTETKSPARPASRLKGVLRKVIR